MARDAGFAGTPTWTSSSRASLAGWSRWFATSISCRSAADRSPGSCTPPGLLPRWRHLTDGLPVIPVTVVRAPVDVGEALARRDPGAQRAQVGRELRPPTTAEPRERGVRLVIGRPPLVRHRAAVLGTDGPLLTHEHGRLEVDPVPAVAQHEPEDVVLA